MRTLAKGLVGFVIAVIGLGLGAGAWLWATEFSAVRPFVVSALEQATGREVTIGELLIAPSLSPTIVAHDVTLANAGWASDEHMLTANRIELQLDLMPLFDRNLQIRRLLIVEPDVWLEKTSERTNWQLWENQSSADPATQNGSSEQSGVWNTDAPFILGSVSVVNANIRFRNRETDEDPLELSVKRLAWSARAATDRIAVSGQGSFRGQQWSIDGTIGTVRDLLTIGDPYPFDLAGRLGSIQASLEGRFGPTTGGEGPLLAAAVSGTQVTELAQLLGVQAPPLGAFRFEAAVVRKPAGYAFRDFELILGESQMSGTAQVTLEGASTPLVEGSIHSDRIDLRPWLAAGDTEASQAEPKNKASLEVGPLLTGYRANFKARIDAIVLETMEVTDVRVDGAVENAKFAADLVSFVVAGNQIDGRIGVTQPQGQVPAVTVALRSDRIDLASLDLRNEEKKDTDTGIFSDEPLPVGLLNGYVADAELRVGELVVGRYSLKDLQLNGTVGNGVLRIEPVSLEVADGRIAGSMTLAPGVIKDGTRSTLALQAEGVDLARLTAPTGAANKVQGRFRAEIDVTSSGNSLEELASGLGGNAWLILQNGRILDTRLNLLVADLDILNLLPIFWRKADFIHVNCFVAGFDIDAGLAKTSGLMDTPEMVVVASGEISLARERLDVTLRPEAKREKLSTVAIPVNIQGPIAKPEVDIVGAKRKAAAGVLRGFAIPLNFLSRFARRGGDETQCNDAIDSLQATGGQP